MEQSTQPTVADLFRPSDHKFTWLGIDFSHAKFIGDFAQFNTSGNKGPAGLRDEFFVRWNDLIMKEPAKYDIAGMLRKGGVGMDFRMINKVNAATAPENMPAMEGVEFSKEDIQGFINNYSMEPNEGVGIMFVCEYLNKMQAFGVYHVVILNLSTKEILIHERLGGKAGGIGLRNYWARSYFEVIKQVKSSYFNHWRKQYV